MEQTVIDFLFSALASLAAQYPEASWIVTAVAVLMSLCGVAAVKSETVRAEVRAVTGK